MKTGKMTFPSHRVGFGKTAWFSILSTLLETHLLESVLSIKLVMTGVRCVDQVLHVCPETKLIKRVAFVIDFNDWSYSKILSMHKNKYLSFDRVCNQPCNI